MKEHFTLDPFPTHLKAFESEYAGTTKEAYRNKVPRIETVAAGKMEEAETSAGIKRDDAMKDADDDWDDENWGKDVKL